VTASPAKLRHLLCEGPSQGFTATPRWPSACSWRPAHDLPDDERARLKGTIRACADHIQRQDAAIELFSALSKWALGDGPLPCDVEAERAAWQYLRAIAHTGSPELLRHYIGIVFPRPTKYHDPNHPPEQPWPVHPLPLLSTRCPDAFEDADPTMTWSEAIARLRMAAALRRSVGATREALRALVDSDAVRAQGLLVEALRHTRGGVDQLGRARDAADWKGLEAKG
jgi:hypothetical protein